MLTADEIIRTQRATWDTFSGEWEKSVPIVQAMLGPVADELIRSLNIRDDQHHLDIASGHGDAGQTSGAPKLDGKAP